MHTSDLLLGGLFLLYNFRGYFENRIVSPNSVKQLTHHDRYRGVLYPLKQNKKEEKIIW